MQALSGIHHISAIVGDPQKNHAFYVDTLGLRLVKKTVNQDDPKAYHLYFGDESGSPGTLMTFFLWPGARRGAVGPGQVTAVAYRIPTGSVSYWTERLKAAGVPVDGPTERFGRPVIALRDPDGMPVELVGHDELDGLPAPWEGGSVPAEHAIRGFHGVTLGVRNPTPTAAVLSNLLGFTVGETDGRRTLFTAGTGADRSAVELLAMPDAPSGINSVGTVHHVAWRALDDADHLAWRNRVASSGLDITPVIERFYFKAAYFREPGGVLFELSTDPPGMTVDEPLATLGESLVLPPWLEPRRAEIERALPPLGDGKAAGGRP